MIRAAEMLLTEGICSLSYVHRTAFPHVQYQATQAKRRLPVVCIRLGEPQSCISELLLMESIPGVSYLKVQCFLSSRQRERSQHAKCSLSKEELGQILCLARSDRERECIRYAVHKSSGLSATQVRKRFGFDNIPERFSRVEEALNEAQTIRECVDSLANSQETAVLKSFGIEVDSSSSDTDHEEQCPDDSTNSCPLPSIEELLHIASDAQFNWFEITDRVLEASSIEDDELLITALNKSFHVLLSQCRESEKEKLSLSYKAFINDSLFERSARDRDARVLNGEVVSDGEIETEESRAEFESLNSERTKALISKRVKAIRRRARYLVAKTVAEQNFLGRKTSSSVRGIINDYPDIGKEIEDFVQSNNVGADHWRRTGVLTFDGNTKVKQRVTYGRIREHLQSKYRRKFSHGTIVQLCVARNRRRRSATRYKGVAKVTARRARKGFQLKYNPDAHWSCALYRGLNYLQYKDGTDIININRDDASGFRLDTMTTHRLHKTLAVQGKDTLTTHTDYVNKYPSLLQCTSYNFSATSTTGELCAGVVKASGVFNKNPAQHLSDLEMLEQSSAIGPAFINPVSNKRKSVECVRVDGASDEGPSHEEVQFFWTQRHLDNGYMATLISARSSGASYLNRVELQNGCLAIAHANLFIPSTLDGTNMDPNTGKLDQAKFTKNMELATEVYINRVNQCPCGETGIELYPGTDSSVKQQMRKSLLIFLKGSKQDRNKLKCEEPGLCEYFSKIWDLRNRHMRKNVPVQYLFSLVCCLEQGCCHPVCISHNEGNICEDTPTWFEGGPSLKFLPIPIPDPNRPWGSLNCQECSGTCTGHYLKPPEAFQSSLPLMLEPPSLVIKQELAKLKGTPPCSTFVENIAKKVLLSTSEVSMWLEHLKTVSDNRKRGAAKAAETRKRRKQKAQSSETTEQEYFCGVCHGPYMQFTNSVENWIGCELCDVWFHWVCVGITTEPKEYVCDTCSSQ